MVEQFNKYFAVIFQQLQSETSNLPFLSSVTKHHATNYNCWSKWISRKTYIPQLFSELIHGTVVHESNRKQRSSRSKILSIHYGEVSWSNKRNYTQISRTHIQNTYRAKWQWGSIQDIHLIIKKISRKICLKLQFQSQLIVMVKQQKTQANIPLYQRRIVISRTYQNFAISIRL